MKKLRKILCVALVLLLLAASVPTAPIADLGFGITASALNATGKCGKTATYTFNSATGKLTIEGTGKINAEAFYSNEDIKEVVIGDGITEIGADAFNGCSNLTTLDLGNTVTVIGYMAFRDCYSLKCIVIPDSVITIGDSAFAYCNNLASAVIGNSVTTIGNEAFFDCDNLASVVIGNGVTTIGNYAFYDCDNLDSSVIGNSVTTIGDSAFQSCNKLMSVVIPDSVLTIGVSAFWVCDNLTSVVIGNGVTSIEGGAFGYCDNLTSMTIGSSVESIYCDAFYNCTSLESINIPKTVTYIGEGAFRYCPSLYDVYYEGSEFEWNAIDIGEYNTGIENAEIHFGAVSEPSTGCEHNTGYEIIPNKPATCEKPANNRYYQCKSCKLYFNRVTNNQLTDEILPSDKETSKPLGHDFADATCMEPKKCKREGCTATEGTPVPHNVDGVEYTKYDDEYHTKKCIMCRTDVAYTKHIFDESVETKAPTCTEKGEMISTCICGAEKKIEIAENGHNYVNGVCTRADCGINCTHNWENGKCKDCNITCQHTGGTASCIEKATCTICGEKHGAFDPINHASTEVYVKNVKEATCYEPGYTGDIYHKCCDSLKQCGDTITVEHDYAITVSKKDDNTHGKKCTNCNSFTEIGIHDWELKATTTPPTCTADGIGVYECKDCNATKEEKINKLNHDTTGVAFEKINDTKHGKKCKLCNMIIEEAYHAYTELVAITLPTCVTTGSETKKCLCGDTKTEVIPANDNHDWGAFTIIKAPTCTEKGEKARVCKRVGCTAKDSVEIILATEHTYSEEKIIIKTPTCKSEGTKATVCINCGDIKSGSEEIVPATHNYPDNWSVLVEPDCETKGINVKICLNCNDLITQKLPKAGHADKDGDSKCDTCNKEIIVTEPDEPAEPDTPDEPEVPEEKPCSCDCHAGGIKAFFFKLINFFAKIFDKSARVCECGKSH